LTRRLLLRPLRLRRFFFPSRRQVQAGWRLADRSCRARFVAPASAIQRRRLWPDTSPSLIFLPIPILQAGSRHWLWSPGPAQQHHTRARERLPDRSCFVHKSPQVSYAAPQPGGRPAISIACARGIAAASCCFCWAAQSFFGGLGQLLLRQMGPVHHNDHQC